MVSPLVLEQKEDVFGFVRAFESQVGGGIAQSNPCGQEKTRVSEYSLVTGRSRSYLATMSHDKGTVQVRRSSSTGFLGSMKERKRKKHHPASAKQLEKKVSPLQSIGSIYLILKDCETNVQERVAKIIFILEVRTN